MKKINIPKRIAFFFLFLISIFSLSGQEKSDSGPLRPAEDAHFLSEFVHKVYTTLDGLPAMSVTAILQDRKGYIWIGTYEGLVRFDGVEFVIFNRSLDPKYDFAAARAIFEDSNGNIWIGHNDEGISCIKTNGQVIKYTTNDGLPNNSVSTICEDKKGNIWIGSNTGVCFLTSQGEVQYPQGLEAYDAEKLPAASLYCDTERQVWFTTGDENAIFVYGGGKFTQYKGITKIENPRVRGICQSKDGALWFGCDPYYVVRVKGSEETVYDVSHEGIDGTAVDCISEDSKGNMWFSTDAGLTVFHDGFFTYYDKNSGAPDNGAKKVLEDREGNFWITYNRGGMEKLSAGKFTTIHMQITVNAICNDKFRDLIWIAADNGLYAYKDNKFIENEVTEALKGARVRHVEVADDGEIFIASYSDKTPLVVVTKEDEVHFWGKEEGFYAIKNRIAIKSKSGDCYSGSTQGLFIWNSKDGTISEITKNNGLENEYIMWLYEDEKGQMWVGTNGSGVYILKDKKIVRHYGTENGLAGNVIFKISRIGNSIWIATSTGLSRYNEDKDSFSNFDSSKGFESDSTFQIIVDNNMTAWMTNNKGIFSADFAEMISVADGFQPKVGIKYYGNSDGLVTTGVTSVSCGMMDQKERLYFPLTDGFAVYDPAKSLKNDVAPNPEIQEYTVDTETFEYFGEKIILPPGTKRLSIKFTGLSFISSESIRFRTRLEGFDEKYSDWSNKRDVSYTNLKYGNYKLFITSQNADGLECEISAPIQIEKLPYLQELWWFWAATCGAIALIIALIIIHKIRSMRRIQIELEQKVEERTHELKEANEKAENLLLNILPKNIADELTENPDRTIAKKYPNATVLFTDIVGFTKLSDKMTAENVVAMLNKMISRFDERAKREGIEKIKTIGDAYMAASGLSEDRRNGGAEKMVRFAQGVLQDVAAFNAYYKVNIRIRIGINTGNLVAGVIGKTKFIYDIWGDTVNVASRMESTGEPMKIHVSETTYAQTKERFKYSEPVEVAVKGKGEMKSYYL